MRPFIIKSIKQADAEETRRKCTVSDMLFGQPIAIVVQIFGCDITKWPKSRSYLSFDVHFLIRLPITLPTTDIKKT